MEARPILIGGQSATEEDLASSPFQDEITVGAERKIQEGEVAVDVRGSIRTYLGDE